MQEQQPTDEAEINEVIEEVGKVLEEVDRKAVVRRERRRPTWMKGGQRVHRLDPEGRLERRAINAARRRLRGKVRRRRRHGRPVGR